MRFIWIQNKKYYLYDTYTTSKEAYNMALKLKQERGTRYFILHHEKGLWFPEQKWNLYLDREIKITW